MSTPKNIQVSLVSSRTNKVESTFTADAVKYFTVNSRLLKAKEFIAKGIAWEGDESYGTYLRIEGKS